MASSVCFQLQTMPRCPCFINLYCNLCQEIVSAICDDDDVRAVTVAASKAVSLFFLVLLHITRIRV